LSFRKAVVAIDWKLYQEHTVGMALFAILFLLLRKVWNFLWIQSNEARASDRKRDLFARAALCYSTGQRILSTEKSMKFEIAC